MSDVGSGARPVTLGCGALELSLFPKWLVVRFDAPHEVLSSALVGGGRRRTTTVAWHEVRNAELGPSVDPGRLFLKRAAERRLSDPVGLLTSRSLEGYVTAQHAGDQVAVQVVATVGLGNALRAGDPPGLGAPVGTINILCRVSAPLSEEAAIETVSLVAEARTLAVLEASVGSTRSGLPSTGTGTDCIVVAWTGGQGKVPFAGKHTEVGHLVGAAVYEAVSRGVREWQEERTRPGAPLGVSAPAGSSGRVPRAPGRERVRGPGIQPARISRSAPPRP